MCGITGYIDLDLSVCQTDSNDIDKMVHALKHRGPDDKGVWVDSSLGLAMGHTRLTIQDLSVAGHQPMKSTSGRYLIVFNGEIYNFKDIRKELDSMNPGISWRGHSDTEVMLAAFDTWGLELSLERFVGMFAFALWDRKERTLFLVRDRMGEKPLYYGLSGNVFLFGSELKSLAKHRSWIGEINKDAVASYLKYGYVPSPNSIYKDIFKVMPGTITTINHNELGRLKVFPSNTYWSIDSAFANASEDRVPADDNLIEEELEEKLRVSLNGQMIADVPVGAFLSGGIDSTTVVSLMQSQTSQKIKTFSIGFQEAEFNEAIHARAIAEHLGTEHTELTVSYDDALALIPDLPEIWDEPFSDASQIPTYLVSKLAQQSVKVCLSGDGGDEFLGGYNRYLLGYRLWSQTENIPLFIRRILAKNLQRLPPSVIQNISRILPEKYRYSEIDNKLYKLASVLDSKDCFDFYDRVISHWREPSNLLAYQYNVIETDRDEASQADTNENFVETLMRLDMKKYLPGNILTKVDRASMGNGLETRLPFLDHRTIEYTMRIPLELKIHHGLGKQPLRNILDKFVPRELIERPKMGFSLPVNQWLKGPLRGWAESLLDNNRLREEGFFNPDMVRNKWNNYLSGRESSHYEIWTLLMFQGWLGSQS